MEQTLPGKGKNTGKNILIGVLAAAVVGLLVCFVMIQGGFLGGGAAAEAGGGITLKIDDDAVPYAGSPLEDRSNGAAGIKIPGYASITIPAGESEVSVSLLNPEDNPCYFTFELVLDDTGESLYTSNMVEPSMCLEQISLDRPLEAGEYAATIKIRTYSLESLTALNNANVKTTLKVV